MALLAFRFRRRGYEVHHFGYRPRHQTLDELSDRLQKLVRDRVEATRYHFIGHSLGNIIVRHGFRRGYRRELGRIVMLAPPNGPASLASSLRGNALYQWWTGDSGQKLGDEAFYRDLPVPVTEFGVVAGDLGPVFTFGEPNDGVVRVENTKLGGMKDFVVVHHTHTLIMMAADTFELSARFLETGSFGEASGLDDPRAHDDLEPPERPGAAGTVPLLLVELR